MVTPFVGLSSRRVPRTRPPPRKKTVSSGPATLGPRRSRRGGGACAVRGRGRRRRRRGARGWRRRAAAPVAAQFETEPSANSMRATCPRSKRRSVPSSIWIVTPCVGLSSTTVPWMRVPSVVTTVSMLRRGREQRRDEDREHRKPPALGLTLACSPRSEDRAAAATPRKYAPQPAARPRGGAHVWQEAHACRRRSRARGRPPQAAPRSSIQRCDRGRLASARSARAAAPGRASTTTRRRCSGRRNPSCSARSKNATSGAK